MEMDKKLDILHWPKKWGNTKKGQDVYDIFLEIIRGKLSHLDSVQSLSIEWTQKAFPTPPKGHPFKSEFQCSFSTESLNEYNTFEQFLSEEVITPFINKASKEIEGFLWEKFEKVYKNHDHSPVLDLSNLVNGLNEDLIGLKTFIIAGNHHDEAVKVPQSSQVLKLSNFDYRKIILLDQFNLEITIKPSIHVEQDGSVIKVFATAYSSSSGTFPRNRFFFVFSQSHF